MCDINKKRGINKRINSNVFKFYVIDLIFYFNHNIFKSKLATNYIYYQN
jgi:hypothetical protein